VVELEPTFERVAHVVHGANNGLRAGRFPNRQITDRWVILREAIVAYLGNLGRADGRSLVAAPISWRICSCSDDVGNVEGAAEIVAEAEASRRCGCCASIFRRPARLALDALDRRRFW